MVGCSGEEREGEIQEIQEGGGGGKGGIMERWVYLFFVPTSLV